MNRRLVAALAVAFLAATLYAPAAHYDFVNFDDDIYVARNENVLKGFRGGGLAWAFTNVHAGYWIPLTWVSYLTDVATQGTGPEGFHRTNILLHSLNAGLLVLVLTGLAGRLLPALLAAVPFALHPLHVESVAWITERKDVLSTLFILFALLAWTRYVRTRIPGHDRHSARIPGHDPNSGIMEIGIVSQGIPANPPIRRGIPRDTIPISDAKSGYVPEFGTGSCPGIPAWVWYVLSIVLFLLGILAKPMVVTFPLLLLVLDWWPLGRLASPAGGPTRLFDSRAARRCLVEKIPLLALSLGFGILTVITQSGGAVVPVEQLGIGQRLEVALVGGARYLGQLAWPAGLMAIRLPPAQWWSPWIVGGAAVLFLALTGAAIVAARQRPWFLAGWAWFLIALAPVSGLAQSGFQSMADRFVYVPFVGLYLLLGWSAARWTGASRRRLAIALLAALVLGSGWFAASRVQLATWRNGETLFRRALEVDPANWIAHNNLAGLLARSGRVAESLEHYRAVVAARPRYPAARINYARALQDAGHTAGAAEEYRATIRIAPGITEASLRLGILLAGQGRSDEALEVFRQALERNPNHGAARYNLAFLLERLGRRGEAAAEYRRVLQLAPDFEPARSGLARTSGERG